MKLKNELYKVTDKTLTGSEASYDIALNPEHFIYQAHFPGEPVTPGVCIIQIAQELLEDVLGKALMLVKVKNVKFLSVISPLQSISVNYHIGKIMEDKMSNTVKAQVVVTSANETKAKISFVCAKQQDNIA